MRDTYARGEFEARNRQLPADLDQNGAYSSSERARSDVENTPLGNPPACYDVRSVFDSRPVNAYDFTITGSDAVASSSSIARVEMTVPEGYMAILRQIDVWFANGNGGGIERHDTTVSMTLNGGDYPNNTDIAVGVASGPKPMFLLADEFNRIGVRSEELDSENTGRMYVEFYGNFLLKNPRPFPFEVANPVLSGSCAPEPPSTSKPATAPQPPPPPPSPLPSSPPPPAPPKKSAPNIVWWQETIIGAGRGRRSTWVPLITSGPGLVNRWRGYKGNARDLTASELYEYRDILATTRPA